MLPTDAVGGNMTGSGKDEEAAEQIASSAEKPRGSLLDDEMQANQSRYLALSSLIWIDTH